MKQYEGFEQIAEADIESASVATLRTVPGRGGTYGENGLTAQGMKERFDALPKLAIARLHALLAYLDAYINGEGNGLESRLEAIDEKANDIAADLADEVTAREDAIAAEAEARAMDISAEAQARETAISAEAQARASAVKAEENSRKAALAEEAATRKAAIDLLKAEILGGASGAYDTLKEIEDALKNGDSEVAAILSAVAAVEASLAGKVDASTVSTSVTSDTIAKRILGGRLAVGRAVSDTDAVPYKQMREELQKISSGGGVSTELLDAITKAIKAIDTIEAKVANLEAGVAPDAFIVDDTTAYVKAIPTEAAPYAEITSIGGITQEFQSGELGETLYDVSELDTSSFYGIDIYPDGKITYNGGGVELYFRDLFPSAEVGKEYVFNYDLQENGHLGNGDITFWDSIPVNDRFMMTEEQYNTNVYFSQNIYDYTGEGFGEPGETTFINISLREVLKGLIDTPVTAIDVYGKNLYNGGFGGNQTTEAGGVLTMSKTSSSSETKTMNWNAPYPMQELCLSADVLEYNTSVKTYAKVTRQDGSVTSFAFCSAGSVGVKSATYIADVSSKCVKSISLYFYGGKIGDSIKMKDILVQPFASPTDTAYSVYRNKTTFAIPAAVQALDGYGKTGYAIEWDEQGKAWWVTPNGRTDISAYFTEDNLIPVEGGGSIVAVNESNLAAPSTIVYQKRGT